MEEYLEIIRQRFRSLNEDEKDTIRKLVGTEEFRVLKKVLGEELFKNLTFKVSTKIEAKKRGLGTR
jgi:hypothetical protein|tara:strand:+ start:391 stop:588 length:198 start_codon:yes stop_codon:yes gene_type:complete